jgi:hypothetical protein
MQLPTTSLGMACIRARTWDSQQKYFINKAAVD